MTEWRCSINRYYNDEDDRITGHGSVLGPKPAILQGWDTTAKKGFSLSDPATLIGFLIGLAGTFVFGIVTGLIILVIAVIIFAVVDSKKVGNVVVGGLVGFLIGLLLVLFVGALFALF